MKPPTDNYESNTYALAAAAMAAIAAEARARRAAALDELPAVEEDTGV